MPDISMCENTECDKHLYCYRFTAAPNPWRQAYADFKPGDDGQCENFWPVTGNTLKEVKE